MKPIKTAVIGVGYLGKFHAQKFFHLEQSELVGVCDVDKAQSETIAGQCKTQAFQNYRALAGQVEAVSIATPTPYHFEVAKFFLEKGVHTLIEKPITTTLEQAEELIQIAKQQGVILQVGHLERFNNVIIEAAPKLQNPQIIESQRFAPFQTRGTDVNVVLDLMIHDLDLIQYLVGSDIEGIHANGAMIITPFTDMVNARVEFKNGCVANLMASRVSTHRERKLKIFQQEGYVTLDLDKKIITEHHKHESDDGSLEIVHNDRVCEQGDPLLEQAKAFLHSIQSGSPAAVSGIDGKRALKAAIDITRILHINRAKVATHHEATYGKA